jgi:excisionase family DNA binding protein
LRAFETRTIPRLWSYKEWREYEQEVSVSRAEEQDRPTEEREMLTSSELQSWLGIGRTKTFELLNDPIHGIPNYRIGRKIVVRRRDVDDWLERNRYGTGSSR